MPLIPGAITMPLRQRAPTPARLPQQTLLVAPRHRLRHVPGAQPSPQHLLVMRQRPQRNPLRAGDLRPRQAIRSQPQNPQLPLRQRRHVLGAHRPAPTRATRPTSRRDGENNRVIHAHNSAMNTAYCKTANTWIPPHWVDLRTEHGGPTRQPGRLSCRPYEPQKPNQSHHAWSDARNRSQDTGTAAATSPPVSTPSGQQTRQPPAWHTGTSPESGRRTSGGHRRRGRDGVQVADWPRLLSESGQQLAAVLRRQRIRTRYGDRDPTALLRGRPRPTKRPIRNALRQQTLQRGHAASAPPSTARPDRHDHGEHPSTSPSSSSASAI